MRTIYQASAMGMHKPAAGHLSIAPTKGMPRRPVLRML